MKILKSAINWIFPDKCMICGRSSDHESLFCTECFSGIFFIDFPYCKVCGKLLETSYNDDFICNSCQMHDRYFDAGRSLFIYNSGTKRMIFRIKRDADESIAKKCSKLLINRYENFIKEADCIIPIPSHFLRTFKRGFNPSTIIAKHLSYLSGVPMNTKILKRIKRTQYQKNKSCIERKENVQNAFVANKKVKDKKILLVDDVITTGSTISECSKTLKENGAKSVFFVTIGSTA